jgi:hypothetical protein
METLGAAAVLAPLALRADAAAGELKWDEFLKECLPHATELHADKSERGCEAYVQFLAALAVRVSAKEIPPAKLGAFPKLDPPVSFGVGYKGRPFFIVEWSMAPGAVLPPHCHPNVSVCTLGLEGEAVLSNYEVVGAAPAFTSEERFEVRRTHEDLIGPGRVATLSPSRDNIHTFRAGAKGARGIDISTYHGPDAGFSFLDVGAGAPKDGRVYTARWITI